MAELDIGKNLLVGRNISIHTQFETFPLVEPTICAHPTDAHQVVAAAMIVTDIQRPYESCRLSSFFSGDGGLTWEETPHDYWGYDPWLSVLENDQTTLSWLGTSGSFQHQFPLVLLSSKNAGKNWDRQVQSFQGNGHGHDGTKLIGAKDRFYLTTVRFNQDMSADVVLFESNSGNPFQEAAVVRGNGRRLNFCEPAVLSTGDVVIPTLHNRGKITAHIFSPDSQRMAGPYVVSANPKLGRGYARMAADTYAESTFIDRLYFVRAVADGGSSQGVWLNVSTDQGLTWSKEKRIDLFKEQRVSKANVPSLAVNHTGIVGVSWVDAHSTSKTRDYDIYFTSSQDGGKSFQRPVRVTEQASDPRTENNGDVANKFIGGGHYLGITAKANGHFQLIWSDSRTGTFALYTSSIEVKN